ncbi:hypothetical protein L2E82_47704 [Cichorium intybus]|uniref:Uncharacterized protein n=1 Tax=Cichorium intybus TaxID=13427 RepID=A0ACB8YVH1_CICIN|nr:hypothetical protein L2E82_47704 [Cichorium intybus]
MDDAIEAEDNPPSIEGSEIDHPMAQASLDSPLYELSSNVTGLSSHYLVYFDVVIQHYAFRSFKLSLQKQEYSFRIDLVV